MTRYTLKAILMGPIGKPISGPTVYLHRHRHGEAGQAIGPHPTLPAGYLEIHTDLDPEEQWLSGDVEIDGVKRWVRPFHRQLMESGAILTMQVKLDGSVEVIGHQTFAPVTVDTGGTLSGSNLRNGLLVGMGNYIQLSHKNLDYQGWARAMKALGDWNHNRTFSSLQRGIVSGREFLEPYTSHWQAAVLSWAKAYTDVGVHPMMTLFDKPSRAQPLALSTWGDARPTMADALGIWDREYGFLRSPLFAKVRIDLCNEPGAGDTVHGRRWDYGWDQGMIRAIGSPAAVTVGTTDRRPIYPAQGVILEEHVWPSWQDEKRLTRAGNARIEAYLRQLQRGNPTCHVALSTDGIAEERIDDPRDLGKRLAGIGCSGELMVVGFSRGPEGSYWTDLPDASKRAAEEFYRGMTSW